MNAQVVAWHPVCKLDDLPALGARQWLGGAEPIAVFRNAIDQVFAVVDRCPHKGGPLSQGIVFGNKVACPLHNWTIDLSSGCADAPDAGCTRVYATKIENGLVYVEA
jgi:nitrite reductase (NADH) small subunit